MLLSHLSEYPCENIVTRKWCDWSEKFYTLWMLAKRFTILANLFYRCYKYLRMLANAVADLTNMLRMKLECKILASNLHNTYCGCFSLSYICQALSNNFSKSTFALHSAEMSIRMQAKLYERHTITYKRHTITYKRHTITTNVLLSIRMTDDCLRMC